MANQWDLTAKIYISEYECSMKRSVVVRIHMQSIVPFIVPIFCSCFANIIRSTCCCSTTIYRSTAYHESTATRHGTDDMHERVRRGRGSQDRLLVTYIILFPSVYYPPAQESSENWENSARNGSGWWWWWVWKACTFCHPSPPPPPSDLLPDERQKMWNCFRWSELQWLCSLMGVGGRTDG